MADASMRGHTYDIDMEFADNEQIGAN